jgi:hypothetical protein
VFEQKTYQYYMHKPSVIIRIEDERERKRGRVHVFNKTDIQRLKSEVEDSILARQWWYFVASNCEDIPEGDFAEYNPQSQTIRLVRGDARIRFPIEECEWGGVPWIPRKQPVNVGINGTSELYMVDFKYGGVPWVPSMFRLYAARDRAEYFRQLALWLVWQPHDVHYWPDFPHLPNYILKDREYIAMAVKCIKRAKVADRSRVLQALRVDIEDLPLPLRRPLPRPPTSHAGS